MKKKQVILLLGILIAVLLISAAVVFILGNSRKSSKTDVHTFSAVTECELFADVPKMKGEQIEFADARDVGANNYLITAENTKLEDYQNYLSDIEKNGYVKYVDNGQDGIEGNIYSAHYQKGNKLLVITYFSNLKETMINVSENEILSEHLIYDDSYVANNVEGAKTKLHAPQLYSVGNSYIFQLKNGHFILNDGGNAEELPYLLDYLESLVPSGEKPVIEAWFISHCHVDHMGILEAFWESEAQAKRVYIENIFFNAPGSAEAKKFEGYEKAALYTSVCQGASKGFERIDGTEPMVYRPRTGDRYYFNDITIDVIYSPELLEASEWSTWNASSVVLMYNIEGQKVLLTADADWECQVHYMRMFDSTYFNLDVYQAPHHGKNVYKEFANYCSEIRSVIYPTYVLGSEAPEEKSTGRVVQNLYFQSKAKEALTYGDGTKVLTFPYTAGSAESLPNTEWIYHAKKPSWQAEEEK